MCSEVYLHLRCRGVVRYRSSEFLVGWYSGVVRCRPHVVKVYRCTGAPRCCRCRCVVRCSEV